MTININFKTKEITYDSMLCVPHINRILGVADKWLLDWDMKLVEKGEIYGSINT